MPINRSRRCGLKNSRLRVVSKQGYEQAVFLKTVHADAQKCTAPHFVRSTPTPVCRCRSPSIAGNHHSQIGRSVSEFSVLTLASGLPLGTVFFVRRPI